MVKKIKVKETCCGVPDAVFYNPYNKVVQCHRCGAIWIPKPKS
jgi:hypothetical protein